MELPRPLPSLLGDVTLELVFSEILSFSSPTKEGPGPVFLVLPTALALNQTRVPPPLSGDSVSYLGFSTPPTATFLAPTRGGGRKGD